MTPRLASLLLAGAACAAPAAAQTASERLLWSFRTDDRSTIYQFIARAPDGTLYTADNTFTYALTPEGDPLWTNPDASGDLYGARPISLGADGTLYTGVSPFGLPYAPVVAINPDGSTRWSFDTGDLMNLACGPGVGPDGNIYAIQEGAAYGGLGVFSLDPDGELLWSNPGDPPIFITSPITTSEIEFGVDRFHAGVIYVGSVNPFIRTFSLEGDDLWSSASLWPHTTDFPQLDGQRRVLCPWGQTGMRAISPDGEEEWFALHPNGASLVKRPAIGASGVIYTGDLVEVQLWALNPDGSTRWALARDPDDFLRVLGVSPDERIIIAGGATPGGPGWVRGYAAADGALLWQADLLPENGFTQYVSIYEPVFTPDSQVVYLTTQFAGGENRYGYVLAMRVGDGACYADCDASGSLDFFDFLCFQNQFAAGAPEADCDGSGSLDFFDFLCFQNVFAAGCE